MIPHPTSAPTPKRGLQLTIDPKKKSMTAARIAPSQWRSNQGPACAAASPAPRAARPAASVTYAAARAAASAPSGRASDARLRAVAASPARW